MKGHFVYGIYVAPGIISPVLESPYIIYRNPTCIELSNNITAREHPRAGSKQIATYQAVAQTQSSWSSSCERTSPRCGRKQMTTYQAVAQTQSSWSSSCEKTSPRCGRKQMATYQAVAQTQSSCLIAARERPRAGSKQMATYQTVVAQMQSSSSSSNLCCSVATHLVCSRCLLAPTHYPLCIMNECWRTPIQRRPQTALLLLLYLVHVFSHTQQQHACCTSLSPSIFPTSLFYPLKIN